jgi:SAM-dependent methyltransferase
MSEHPIDPRRHQPALPLPEGTSRESIVETLCSFSIDGSQAGGLDTYAREDCDRFLYTLSLIPEGKLKVLEVGGNPYFTTYLTRRFRPDAEVTLLNYFGGDVGVRSQTLVVTGTEPQEHYTFDYLNTNIEVNRLPHKAATFDLVLYCEVIEHMTHDPIRSLLELKRVLKPGGQLIVTTPNVARLENVARMLSGANVYDPYSGYGPYGRHNREYTRHELHHLLRYCGFTEEVFFTADVHENRAGDYFDLSQIEPLVRPRAFDLGQYLFTRCRNTGPGPQRRPGWLYRSYAEGSLDHSPI